MLAQEECHPITDGMHNVINRCRGSGRNERVVLLNPEGLVQLFDEALPRNLNCVACLEALLENLAAATHEQEQVETGLLLDVVIRQGLTVLELRACESQALQIGRDALQDLDLLLQLLDGVAGFHRHGDRLARQ